MFFRKKEQKENTTVAFSNDGSLYDDMYVLYNKAYSKAGEELDPQDERVYSYEIEKPILNYGTKFYPIKRKRGTYDYEAEIIEFFQTKEEAINFIEKKKNIKAQVLNRSIEIFYSECEKNGIDAEIEAERVLEEMGITKFMGRSVKSPMASE